MAIAAGHIRTTRSRRQAVCGEPQGQYVYDKASCQHTKNDAEGEDHPTLASTCARSLDEFDEGNCQRATSQRGHDASVNRAPLAPRASRGVGAEPPHLLQWGRWPCQWVGNALALDALAAHLPGPRRTTSPTNDYIIRIPMNLPLASRGSHVGTRHGFLWACRSCTRRNARANGRPRAKRRPCEAMGHCTRSPSRRAPGG